MNPQDFRRTVLASRAGSPAQGKKPTAGAEARNAVCSLLGAGIGWYCGVIFLVPFVFSAATFWLARKWLNEERKLVLPTLAIQAGLCLWLLLGAVLQHRVDVFFFDIVWLLGGLIWLVASPRLLPVCLLAIYQLLSLARSGMMFMHAQIGTPVHKGLLVHLVWQVFALVSLGILFVELRVQAKRPGPTGSGAV